jgi:hypothetical protein
MRRFSFTVRNRFLAVMCAGCCISAAAGCGKDTVKLVPVVGQITVDGTALTTGSVSFRPDKAKGNTTELEPAGEIDAQGKYKLYSALRSDDVKEGAPPGWYKVAIISAEPGVYPPTKFFLHRKYGDTETSQLSVQVVEGAPPGTYDFRLSNK